MNGVCIMKNDSSRFGHIIQLFTVLLTAILISLFFAALVLVGKIQGTARVVNYAGLVRGKTQRIVKLEISGTPEDDLLDDVASYIEGLRFGSSELDLVRLDDADFQAKMTALSSEFDDLRNELILVRQRGYTETAIIAKSEHFFQTCDEATNLAEVYSQKRATALDFLEKVVLADIVGLLLLFGYQIFKALRYAAMNRILQRKVYLDEATGLPNKNKCEELLDAPDPPDGDTALCVFDLNNLRTVNNNLGHDKGDKYIRSFAEQLRLAVPSQHFVGRDGGGRLRHRQRLRGQHPAGAVPPRRQEYVCGQKPCKSRGGRGPETAEPAASALGQRPWVSVLELPLLRRPAGPVPRPAHLVGLLPC